MNIQEYMLNPLGKGNAVFMIKETQRLLDEQYRLLNGKMRVTWYSLHDKYYIAHVRIPSRSVENLNYDVLIEFNMETVPSGTSVINNASVRVFSNCPSFTYTYANVFDSTGDLITWSKTKYQKEIFSKDPVKRNPYKLKAYERSIYLAFKYVISNGRNLVRLIDQRVIRASSHSSILLHVYSNQDIEDLYRAKMKRKKKDEKGSIKKPVKTPKGITSNNKSSQSNTVKTTRKTKKIGSTNRTKSTRKI